MNGSNHEKTATVLRTAGATMLKLASERDAATARAEAAEAKLAAVQQRLEAEKLASEMHQKGLNTDLAYDELVLEIEKEASAGKLPVIKEAVKMAAPNMGTHIGSINHDEARGGNSDLERFIVGDVG
jgi:hypothetical protein